MKKFLTFIFLVFLGTTAGAQHFNQYCNSIFPFCLDIPGVFNRIGESKTGYGQHFSATGGGSLVVYGAYNVNQESLKFRFDQELNRIASDSASTNSTQLPSIDQTEMLENAYTIRYQDKEYTNLIYRKLVNNNWLNLELKYPTSQASKYQEFAKRMIATFK